jgi:serine/threonine protein kinase
MPNNCRAAGGVPSRTVTCEEGPLPADREEEVVRNAVGSQVLTPEQGRAAFIVSRLTRTPVADVLRQNGVTRDSVVDALDEEARDTFIPGYRIIAKVGRGSQGVVYRAIQKCLDREVALKVVSLRGSPGGPLQHRLQREARAIGRLSHPNIVRAYDYGESRGRIYLAMEFVEGSSCERRLQERPVPFPRATALGIARDVALGLRCALESGIIHRDVKPANILLSELTPGRAGVSPWVQAKLADLGLSRTGRSDLTIEGTVLGTPGYMAPEQARGHAVDHQADIYALGATLYHLLTGQRPFAAADVRTIFVQQALGRLSDPRHHDPAIPQGLVYLLQGMLSRNPETRYVHYDDLLEDIDRVAAGAKPLWPLPPLPDRTLEAPDRHVLTESPASVDTGSRILVLDREAPGLLEFLARIRAARRPA